jgi:hypothetical protein
MTDAKFPPMPAQKTIGDGFNPGIPSPFRVGQEVEARFDGPRRTGRGIIRRITEFSDREAFHVVEMPDGEYGFGTQYLTPCPSKVLPNPIAGYDVREGPCEELLYTPSQRPNEPTGDRGCGSPWRVGRSVGRTLYCGDELVGMVDTPALAEAICEAMSARWNGGSTEPTRPDEPRPAVTLAPAFQEVPGARRAYESYQGELEQLRKVVEAALKEVDVELALVDQAEGRDSPSGRRLERVRERIAALEPSSTGDGEKR